MGYTSWSSDAYDNLSASYVGQSASQIFSSNLAASLNPNGLVFRESRDSDAHPNSIAIAIFLDVTGSMGVIPEVLVRQKLGTLMDTLLAHDVEDPQVMFSAIGDHISDRAPLQVGQYESGTDELDQGLANIYIEGGGGGQMMESYLLAWLVAGRHTSIDCFEKRNKKGFLFTIGDEKNWDKLDANTLKNLMGYPEASTMTDVELLAQAQRMYHVFHIHVNEASYRDNPDVIGYWRKMLGERLLIIENHLHIAELIASTVAVINGANLNTVTAGFDADTAKNIQTALMKVHSDVSKGGDSGVIKL
jgi:hypothetical protein